MARGRFISNTLGGSKKFSRLKNDTHRLAYVMLVTHADVAGRVDAYPPLLRGYAYTLMPWTDDQIQAALEDMHRVGLITLYTVDNEQYAEILDFDKHNKVRADREKPSDIPCPPESSSISRENAGSTPQQVEVEVQVQVQDKVQVQETTSSSGDDPIEVIVDDDPLDYQAIVDAYNENCGRLPKIMKLNSTRKSRLRTLVRDLGSVEEAIAVVSIAAREVGQNEFWIKKEYNLDNLLNGQKLIGKAEIAMQRGSFDHHQAEIDRMLGALGGNDA